MITFLGIGTNLGDREANIRTALRLLAERVGEMLACSAPYHSAPMGFVSDNPFVNVVVSFRTTLSPHALLAATQDIERAMGRTEKSVNGQYHDRIIDIDLLLCFSDSGQMLTCASPDLILPHPRMSERDFVMVPLHEICQNSSILEASQTPSNQQHLPRGYRKDTERIPQGYRKGRILIVI